MIKYALKCAAGHGFEGWFSNSADYDEQAAQGQLSCPACGTAEVEKALMAPAVATSRRSAAAREEKARAYAGAMVDAARKARDYVEKNFENVGKRFPEEARKIHYGEADERPIFGDATPQEARELKEEGVEIAPVPPAIPDPKTAKTKLN